MRRHIASEHVLTEIIIQLTKYVLQLNCLVGEITASAIGFMSFVCTMQCRLIAVCLYLMSVLSFARAQEAQVDCPAFNVSDLGATNMLTQGGLVISAFQAVTGDISLPVSVQVHNSNIVCLRSGQTSNTYNGVSVVVNYTCTGPMSQCTGNPILSQFEFECVAGTWAPSVGGSATNIITTPPSGSLSTILRTDCGVCVSPSRSGFATITNNDQHCGCKWWGKYL